MKTIKKIIKITLISIVSLFSIIILTALLYTPDYQEEDKGLSIGSFEMYNGTCNEIYKGKTEIYLKDSIYTQYTWDGKVSVIGVGMAEHWTEMWSSIDYDSERKESEECLSRGQKRKNDYLNRQKKKKELANAIEDVADAIEDLNN
tara:strand:+ start:84 stop:521 length:438 start_codon:yes stop_codon:yes gene_type:complete